MFEPDLVDGAAFPWPSGGTVRTLTGAEGLASLADGVSVEAQDAAAFGVESVTVALGDSVVVRQRSDAHAVQRTRDAVDARPSDDVCLTVVIAGSLSGEQDGRSFDCAAGDLVLRRMDAPFEYGSRGPSDVVHVRLGRYALGAKAARLVPAATAIVPRRTALQRATVSYVAALIDGPPPSEHREGVHLERAVVALVDALVVETADRLRELATVEQELLIRAREIIDARLADPGLDPQAVADELGIGIRTLQRIYADLGIGIAEDVRVRRLERIAALLRDPAWSGSLTALPVEVGFAGPAQAARAFKVRFGATMRDYRSLHRA